MSRFFKRFLRSAARCGPAQAKQLYQAWRGRVPDQIHLAWVDDPATSLTFVWRTARPDAPSLVQYRPVGATEWQMEVGMPRPSGAKGTLHEVTVRHLQPATSYEYRVKGDYYYHVWSDVFQTQTAPPPGPADFDVVYLADTGLVGRKDGLSTGTQQVIDEIAKLQPTLVLGGGDYVYYITDRRYGSLENSIDAWFDQMRPIAVRSPIMPTYGNHEVLLQENYQAWAQRFPTPEGFDHRRNYSFDVGDAHFVSIFAVYENQGLSPEVLAWLEQDIQAAKAAGQRWIIPFMHVSAFADGTSHPANLALRAQLGPLFERLGVQVVLSSHDQAYERTYPLIDVPASNRPTSRSQDGYTLADGVTWVKSSPGGKKSNQNYGFSKFHVAQPDWVAVRNNTLHVFTRLRFSQAGILKVETWAMEGDGTPPILLDSFSYTAGSRPSTHLPAERSTPSCIYPPDLQLQDMSMSSSLNVQQTERAGSPEVTVIMPAYNTSAYIRQAIESALGQTLSNIEVIVVDDASTDDTVAIAQSFSDPRLKVLTNAKNLGAAAARNRALAVAQGKWIAVLDSDDWYAPDRLEQLVALAYAQNADMLADDMNFTEADGSAIWGTLINQSGEPIRETQLIDPVFFVETDVYGQQGLHLGLSKPLIRREFLLQHGIQYDESIRMGQDFFLYLRCLIQGARFFLTPTPYYFYRSRPGSLITRSQVDRLNQACRATASLLQLEAVQHYPKLAKALSFNLAVYQKNRAYYRVVEPLKQGSVLVALVEMVRNPYFWVRFISGLPKSVMIRVSYLLGNRLATRRGVYTIRSIRVKQS